MTTTTTITKAEQTYMEYCFVYENGIIDDSDVSLLGIRDYISKVAFGDEGWRGTSYREYKRRIAEAEKQVKHETISSLIRKGIISVLHTMRGGIVLVANDEYLDLFDIIW